MAVSGPTVCVPEKPLLPLQPPEAVQAVAFDEDHVSTLVAPLAIVVGLALSCTDGTDGGGGGGGAAPVAAGTIAHCGASPYAASG